MRFFTLACLAFALTACAMPDGRTYFLLTADDYYSAYAQGVVDLCLEDAADSASRYRIPPSAANLAAIVETCQGDAHRLLQERGIEVMPVPMPTTVPASWGRM